MLGVQDGDSFIQCKLISRTQLGFLSSPAKTLVFQAHEPQIDFIHAADIFVEDCAVCILSNRRFCVTSFEVGNELVKLIYFGVHNAEVGNKPDFLNVKPSALSGIVRFFIVHSPPSDQQLRLPFITEMRRTRGGLYLDVSAAFVYS
jgi:hypothetical protein